MADDAANTNTGIPAPLVLADVIRETRVETEKLSNRAAGLAGIPTGFADLDALTGGLRPSQLIVIGGRVGLGKSTLAQDLLRSSAIRHAIPAALFTLESTRVDVGQRLLCAEARVPLHYMRAGTMNEQDLAKLKEPMGEISGAPLFVQDTHNQTFTQIRDQVRSLVADRGVRLVVVDSINLLTYGTRPFENRYLEISEISRCLKQLAKELKISIVAVSQLNRNVESRPGRIPMLVDLRDSGTLEDNADVVILLHREDAYERESPRAGEADLIVAKHRMGLAATITVAFQGHYSRFVDMATS